MSWTKEELPHLVWECLQMDNRIVKAIANPQDYTVEVTYADGESYVLSFVDTVHRIDWTKQMAPAEVFSAVRIGDYGDSIEWPTGYDCCADALRWEGELSRRGLTKADIGEE